MTKYRKKPVTVEAEQFWPNKKPWPNGVIMTAVDERDPSKGNHRVICTLGGNIKVSSGDWIITGVKGEKYPCKPDIFHAAYELVE